MWLKFLLSFLIIGFCIGLGYIAAEKYRARRRFFAQLDGFNERYLNELSYARTPLNDFLRAYPYAGDFGKSVEAFAAERKLSFAYGYLTKEERADCADYFSMLGKGDAASQSGYFSAKKVQLAEQKATAEREAKARGELYLKLGLLAGLAFVILII